MLSAGGTRVTLNADRARAGLSSLSDGLRQRWIPRAALNYDEAASQQAFEAGKLLFLNNWPYVFGEASVPGPGNHVAGRVGVTALPGPDGPGFSSLAGSGLPITPFSPPPVPPLNFFNVPTT